MCTWERVKANMWRLYEKVHRNGDVKYKISLHAVESHWKDRNGNVWLRHSNHPLENVSATMTFFILLYIHFISVWVFIKINGKNLCNVKIKCCIALENLVTSACYCSATYFAVMYCMMQYKKKQQVTVYRKFWLKTL